MNPTDILKARLAAIKAKNNPTPAIQQISSNETPPVVADPVIVPVTASLPSEVIECECDRSPRFQVVVESPLPPLSPEVIPAEPDPTPFAATVVISGPPEKEILPFVVSTQSIAYIAASQLARFDPNTPTALRELSKRLDPTKDESSPSFSDLLNELDTYLEKK